MSARAVTRAIWLLGLVLGCGDDAPGAEPQDATVAVVPGADASVDAGSVVVDAGGLDAGKRLSETGLYADIRADRVASEVRAFVPQGVLWSDGADKRRWVFLPPGMQIQSKDMDNWILPIGTKLWKEFALNGKRLETRLLEKTGKDKWTMVAYAWLDDQSDAIALPDGRDNAQGTTHDIPPTKLCERCHEGVADTAIGFSAVQLSHANAQYTLDQLVAEQRLTVPPTTPLLVPGSAAEKSALVYLHANCGNCHNERTFISNVTDVNYQLKAADLGSVTSTRSYRTIKRDLERGGGAVEATNVVKRMAFRGAQGQMPPVASDVIDNLGLAEVRALVSEWADAGSADAGIGGGLDAGTP